MKLKKNDKFEIKKKKRNGKKWRKLKEKIKELHCSYNSKSSILILGLLV